MYYRRDFTPGGTYFFTVVTSERRPLLAGPGAVEILRGSFRTVMADYPFRIDAIVVLPDHLHTIWTLPEGDADYPFRWNRIKGRFTEVLSARIRPIWQNRYWEHRIRDDADFNHHVSYIHWNPVKHGLAQTPEEWAYSSYRFR
ncbi:transposase [Skermanella aerolata]|uniref:Transposase n=2 Tax=Skermanella aerolata TaxID=393310 RepID=A0A512DL48_9PROT|nr:transposase [Skermanella aerolata KACC 11604]GEO37202.1 transposase [Skermanella aerolata]